jgi:hypothetical protein
MLAREAGDRQSISLNTSTNIDVGSRSLPPLRGFFIIYDSSPLLTFA